MPPTVPRVKTMRKLGRKVTVYLDEETCDWLDGKALEGYKKAALVRRIIAKHRESEVAS
jgi:hypothetical protein